MRSDRNIEMIEIKSRKDIHCKRCEKEDLLLYAVTDRHWLMVRRYHSQVAE